MNRQDFEALGDYHKRFEQLNVRKLIPEMPIMIRLDGKSFHTFTKGLKRPFDVRLSLAMMETTTLLVDKFNATIGYTQSDEITLIIPAAKDPLHGGKIDKINSVVASSCSVEFFKQVLKRIPEKVDTSPVFDCRCWQYPKMDLCIESLLWREADATRNSLTMAAASLYDQSELQGVNSRGQHDLLHAKGINWNDYPAFFKRGSYFGKRDFVCALPAETWNKIPEKHRPSTNEFVRSKVVNLNMPILSTIINPMGVVFAKAAPSVDTRADIA